MKKYFLYLVVWIFLFWVFSHTQASRPLHYISCEIQWTIQSVEFQQPQIDDCVTDNTFSCPTILWGMFEWAARESRYTLSIDIKANNCTNLDTNESYVWSLGINNYIRIFRYNTWIEPKVWDTITWVTDSFNYLKDITLNSKKEQTYRERWELKMNNIEKLREKYQEYEWERWDWNHKIYEINDKLKVFTLRLQEDQLESYIRATERMLRNPRFENMYWEIELLRYNLYLW